MVTALAVLVVVRFAFQAVFLPVFEGPDEPFHLGRILAFRDTSFAEAFRGARLSPAIVSAVSAYPCGPDLHRALACPLFDGGGATFNILKRPATNSRASVVENYENQQPPLFYLTSGMAYRLVSDSSDAVPNRVALDLLVFRVLSVILVSLSLLWLGRAISVGWSSDARTAILVALLLPGAAEALARCSNDAALFFWSAAVVSTLKKPGREGLILTLLALGPLIKLTAIPVVVMAVVYLWVKRGSRMAAAGAFASLLVLPVEILRGWRGPRAYDLSAAWSGLESVGAMLLGMARSVYTLAKTVFWLGGWSFFRAPGFLVVAWFLFLAIVLFSARIRRDCEAVVPHAAGILVAGGGVLLLSIGNWRVFGDWGGLGGWYVWTWLPWLAAAGTEALRLPRRLGRKLLIAEATFVVVANVLYFTTAFEIYG